MDAEYKISFIIPAFNCRHCLENCVASIRRISEYCDIPFEIVIVDDGSTDGTAELCDILGDLVIHQKNAGVSAARNTGIKNASGDFVVFIDSDDCIEAEFFAELLKELAENSQTDVAAYGIYFDYYKGGKCYRSDKVLPPLQGVCKKTECLNDLYSLYERNVLSPVWNKIIRKDILTDNYIEFRSDMFLYEDLEFSLRLLNAAENWYFFTQPVYHYYQIETSSKAGGRLKRVSDLSQLVESLHAPLNLLGEEYVEQVKTVLLTVYLTLAGQKINVSDRSEITEVCESFAKWIDEQELFDSIKDKDYAMSIYNRKVDALMAKREFSRLRHKTAVAVKSVVGDFRKWSTKN